MQILTREDLERYTQQEMFCDLSSANLRAWRLGVRQWVIYRCYCRFDCFNQLEARDITFLPAATKLHFRTGKTDQLYMGKQTYIPVEQGPFDLGKLLRRYLAMLGVNNSASCHAALNCRLRRHGSRLTPDTTQKLTYASAVAELKWGMQQIGKSTRDLGEKSSKMGGVTAAYERGVALDKIRDQGRWSATGSVLHYIRSEDEARSKACQEFTDL